MSVILYRSSATGPLDVVSSAVQLSKQIQSYNSHKRHQLTMSPERLIDIIAIWHLLCCFSHSNESFGFLEMPIERVCLGPWRVRIEHQPIRSFVQRHSEAMHNLEYLSKFPNVCRLFQCRPTPNKRKRKRGDKLNSICIQINCSWPGPNLHKTTHAPVL